MSYPFTTFPLVNRVGVTNPYAAVDARYGPWNTRNDALTSFNAGLRSQGLTVGIIESEKVVEYWYRDGVSDENLILKSSGIDISTYLPLSGGNITGNLNVFGVLSGSNVDGENSLKIEGSFLNSKAKPQGNVVLRDTFTETTSRELTLHTPNTGTSWTRIYETVANARLDVTGGLNEIKPSTSLTFQGAIYQANASFTTQNHELKVFCKEIPPVDVLNFDVFWLLTRIQDINNFYAVRFGVQSNDCAIYKKVSGTFTLLKQLNLNFPSRFNFYVSLRVNENVISVYVNDNFVDSVTDNSLTYGAHGIGIGNIGVRGNDSIDTRTILSDLTVTLYNGFEKDSYINQNNFGIGTKTPNEKLTVSGNISASGNISLSGNITASGSISVFGGSSQHWNSNFATVCSLSSVWNQSFTILPTVTSYLYSNNILVSSISALSGGDSFKWTETYNIVNANSATTWNYQGTDVRSVTAKYENLHTFIQNTSANWEESAEIIPTVTNHLSTNQIQISALITQDNVYDSGYFWRQGQVPNNNVWTDVTYGNGLFVAIANTNTVTPNKIMTSPDGTNWTLRSVPVENNWVSITYGNGLFVAVANAGDGRRVLISSDTINWTAINVPNANWNYVVYGNGGFVAIASGGIIQQRIMYSSDGVTWTLNNSNLTFNREFRSIAYGNRLFFAVTDNAIFTSSNNGEVWQLRFSVTGGVTWNSIVYANGFFIAINNNGGFGVTLANVNQDNTLVTPNETNANFSNARLYYANGLLFIICDTGIWVNRQTFLEAAIFGSNLVINNSSWERTKNLPTSNAYQSIVYGNNIFVLLVKNFVNNINVFISGKQKLTDEYNFTPRWGNLTLYGNISSQNLFVNGGNSLNWNSTFSTLCSNSANWNFNVNEIQKGVSTFNTVCSLSSNWNSVYSTWQNTSSFELSARNLINLNGLNWNSVFNQVCSLSTNWGGVYTYDAALDVNSTNAVQNSAIAVKIQNIESNLNLLVDPPNYVPPTATLTNFTIPVYEVGEFASQFMQLNWNQNNAGAATNFALFRNNIFQNQNANAFNFNVNEIVVQGTTTFKNVVSYNTGPILNNILGNPDTRGRILAGSVEANRSYIGRFIQFYGTVATIPANLRTLPLSSFDDVNSFSIQVNQNNTVLAIPNNKSLILARTQNFQDVTNAFTLSATSVNDANGVGRPYKRYVQTTSVPFNLRIDFTLA